MGPPTSCHMSQWAVEVWLLWRYLRMDGRRIWLCVFLVFLLCTPLRFRPVLLSFVYILNIWLTLKLSFSPIFNHLTAPRGPHPSYSRRLCGYIQWSWFRLECRRMRHHCEWNRGAEEFCKAQREGWEGEKVRLFFPAIFRLLLSFPAPSIWLLFYASSLQFE